MNRNEIVEQLKQNLCEVTFTKVNGEQRTMPCTLREDFLPVQETVSESKRKPNDDVVSVWVTDINQWRSFRVDSVISINTLETL